VRERDVREGRVVEVPAFARAYSEARSPGDASR